MFPVVLDITKQEPERGRIRVCLPSKSFFMAITPKHTLLHQLHANCYAGDDEDEDNKFRHQQKRRRVLVVVWVEIMCRKEERIQRQNLHRTYLTQPNMNPAPLHGTPWQHMHARGNACAFTMTMGIDVATFEFLLDQGFAEAWNSTPILETMSHQLDFLVSITVLSTLLGPLPGRHPYQGLSFALLARMISCNVSDYDVLAVSSMVR